MQPPLERRGILYMILAAFAFSIMLACSKALADSLPVMEVVFFRALATALAALPFLIVLRLSPLGTRPLLITARGVIGFCALSLNFYAHAHLPLNDAGSLTQTSVLFTPFLAALLLGEVVTRRVVILTGIAFLGVLLILRPSTGFLNVPGMAGLLSGFLSALVYITIRKLHSSDHWSTIIFSFSVVSCLGAIVVGGSSFIVPNAADLPTIVILGISGSVGQYLMTASLRYAPAPIVTPYTFFQILFAMVWGYLVWDASPAPLSVLGSLLVVGAGVGILRTRPTVAAP